MKADVSAVLMSRGVKSHLSQEIERQSTWLAKGGADDAQLRPGQFGASWNSVEDVVQILSQLIFHEPRTVNDTAEEFGLAPAAHPGVQAMPHTNLHWFYTSIDYRHSSHTTRHEV